MHNFKPFNLFITRSNSFTNDDSLEIKYIYFFFFIYEQNGKKKFLGI